MQQLLGLEVRRGESVPVGRLPVYILRRWMMMMNCLLRRDFPSGSEHAL